MLTYAVDHSTGGPGHSKGYDMVLNRHYQQIAPVEGSACALCTVVLSDWGKYQHRYVTSCQLTGACDRR